MSTEIQEMLEDAKTQVVRGKWIMDGAMTLEDAADMLRNYADYLETLHFNGFVLREGITDDYGFAYLPEA